MRATRATPANATAEPATSEAERSFQALFLEHWSMIHQLLTRMLGDPAEAEDLALETFLRLYRHPPKTGEGSNLRGWLFRVATHLGLHAIRSDQRRLRYELAAGKLVLDESGGERPAELVEQRESNHLARQALAQMQPRQSTLLTLRYSGLAYKEIALQMGLAPASIGPLLLRAEREFARIYRSLNREEE